MRRDKKKKDKKKSKKFKYTSRDSSKAKERAEKGGGDFDTLFKDNIITFAPNDGDNLIRPLPPTCLWPAAFKAILAIGCRELATPKIRTA